jgi:hypothetical protein
MELLSLPLVRVGKLFHIFAWWSRVIVGAISAQQQYWSTHYWYFNHNLVIFLDVIVSWPHSIASLHRQISWMINLEKILYICASSGKTKKMFAIASPLWTVLGWATLIGRHINTFGLFHKTPEINSKQLISSRNDSSLVVYMVIKRRSA